jgi:protein-L-isoaspartate O-methyltransferase
VKQTLLHQILQSTGISRAAAEAVSTARHEFVPARRRRFAYLNASTSVLGDTNISARPVVGATNHWTSETTVEIEIG